MAFSGSAAYLGATLAHLGAMLARHLGAMLAYLEGNVGPSWGSMLAHLGANYVVQSWHCVKI